MHKAEFHCDSITATRNSPSWLHMNIHDIVQSNFQHRFLINILRVIAGSHAYGLHVVRVRGHLTAASYRHWQENELQLHLENVPLQTRCMLMQHNRMPPNFDREVTEYLNANYQGRWIKWGEPITLSSDFIPLAGAWHGWFRGVTSRHTPVKHHLLPVNTATEWK
jgi:hypothetical protein